MEQITIGQIAVIVAFLATLISGISVLATQMKKWIGNAMKEPMEEIKKDVKSVKDDIEKVDMNACKNFLVASIADVENGYPLGEIESERFWEQYEHYIQKGGNSYIKRKVEQLKADGKM